MLRIIYLYFLWQDFGDGGAYPEIHVAQFPMGLGLQNSKAGTSNALAKQVDADGKIKYDVIARYGHAQDKVCRMFCFANFMIQNILAILCRLSCFVVLHVIVRLVNSTTL